MSAPHDAHRERAPRALTAAILTVSDTRRPETDESGSIMDALLRAAGHVVASRDIVADEADRVIERLQALGARPGIDLILLNGGTGIAPRDSTFEAVSGLLEKTLPGFGELFRSLSFAEIGAAALASRAVGGIFRGRLLFSTPGSPAAVRLAMEKLILPEAPHLIGELRRARG
jgi:molybdenum cofactor biosynthesis protein B